MQRHKGLLEGILPNPAIGFQEGLFFAVPQAEIGIDQLLDGIDHFFRREAAADDFTNGRVFVGGAPSVT